MHINLRELSSKIFSIRYMTSSISACSVFLFPGKITWDLTSLAGARAWPPLAHRTHHFQPESVSNSQWRPCICVPGDVWPHWHVRSGCVKKTPERAKVSQHIPISWASPAKAAVRVHHGSAAPAQWLVQSGQLWTHPKNCRIWQLRLRGANTGVTSADGRMELSSGPPRARGCSEEEIIAQISVLKGLNFSAPFLPVLQ